MSSSLLAAVCFLLPSGLVPARAPAQGTEGGGADGRYIRLVEEGPELHLEMAVKRFAPAGDGGGARGGGPDVVLAAAIHVAEARYYEELQAELDGHDLVLFESVKPPGTGDPAHDVGATTEAQRVAVTEGRIRFVASAVHRFRERAGRWPADLDELAGGLPRDLAVLAANARTDAWGRPLRLAAAPERTDRPFDVQSLGADGRVGGEGVDADLCFADQDELTDVELGEAGGIQQDLADALGLVFQLDAMDHDRPHWRNSDLSLDQVEARLAGSDVSSEDVLGPLRGSSFVAKAAGFALDLLMKLPFARAAMQIVGIEVLARADEVLEAAPPEMAGLLEVLVHDRNAVVIEDLREVLASGAERETVAVIYGAAHMRGIEEGVREELGYVASGERWLRAVTVDTRELGLSPGRVKWLRETVREALEEQLSR